MTNPATREPSVTACALARPRRAAAAGWTWASGAATPLGGCWASRRRPWASSRRPSRDPRPGRGPADRVRRQADPARLTARTRCRSGSPATVPMALRLTGRIADGVILQLADPDLIRWFVRQVRESAVERAATRVRQGHGRRAGARRGPGRVPRPGALVPGAGQQPRRRPGQQVPARDLPAALTAYVRDREGYDYLPPRRGRLVNAEFVHDRLVDRFCVVGPVEEHVREAAGRSPRRAWTSSTSTS